MESTWIITIIIGALAFFLTKFWLTIRSFPPGPIPLPVVGNILSFRTDIHPFIVLDRFRRIYGDIFTLWMGSEPVIIICNWHLLKEALITKSRDFIGRKKRLLFEIQMGGHDNILFGNYGSTWESMRKIATSAIRKYSISEKFRDLVCHSMDEMLERINKEPQPFDPEEILYFTVHNIIAYSAFGTRHGEKDKEFVELKDASGAFINEIAVGLPSDFIPILRPVYWQREQHLRKTMTRLHAILHKKYIDHVETYQAGKIRDFCDAVIAARLEEENFDCAHLTDANFINIVNDLFIAGTHTILSSLTWLILLLSNFEDVQRKIAKEIEEVIGNDRLPSQADKAKCHYTSAVIMEAQRFRTVAPLGLDHTATCDSEIGGFPIKKGTTVIFSLVSNHADAEVWPKPQEFQPERFLDNGLISRIRKDGYVPFSAGRRGCVGEKLATTEIFLAITRIVQQYTLSLPTGAGSANLDPKEMMFYSLPKPYKICIKRRDNCVTK